MPIVSEDAFNTGNIVSEDEFFSEEQKPSAYLPTGEPVTQKERQTKAERLLGSAAEVAPEIIGGTVGGILGGPPGAVLGAAAGEAYQQLGQRAGVIPGEAPETSLEAAKDIAVAGATEFAAGKVAKLAGAGISRILPTKKPYIKAVTKEAEEALEVLRPQGSTLTLAQATENKAFDIAENIAEGSLFGGGRVTASKKMASETAEKTLKNFVDDFGTTVDRGEVKEIVRNTIKGNQDVWRQAGNAFYKKLDDVTEGITVDISGIKQAANEIAKTAPPGRIQSIVRFVNKQPDNMSFVEANNLRSILFAEADSPITKKFGRRTVASATRLAKQVDNSMSNTAKRLDKEEAINTWRQASEFWKQGSDKFNNALVQKLATKDPESLVDTLLSSTEPVDVRAIRNAVTNTVEDGKFVPTSEGEEAWKNVQGRLMRRIMSKSTDVSTGVVDGKDLLTKIKGMKEFGTDTLKEFFPEKKQLEQFEKFARVLAASQKGTGIGTGKVAIQLLQPGIAIGVLAGTGDPLSAGAILLGPAAMAQLFTRPKALEFILKGSKGIRTVEGATKFLSKAGTFMAREGIEHEIRDRVRKEETR